MAVGYGVHVPHPAVSYKGGGSKPLAVLIDRDDVEHWRDRVIHASTVRLVSDIPGWRRRFQSSYRHVTLSGVSAATGGRQKRELEILVTKERPSKELRLVGGGGLGGQHSYSAADPQAW
jgi:hypothetical protein